MTKWELAQMMGASVEFKSNTKPTMYNTTLVFGKTRKYFNVASEDKIDYEYAAEMVFGMIRNAVDHVNDTWKHP